MKLNKFFLLLILFFFVTSCSFLPKPAEYNKEKLLYEHLKFWENIRIDGIIEANYKSFVFRKNITIKKNSSAFRIDIYDSGIFGMQPTPFISAYYDSVLTIRTPDQQINHIIYENNEEINQILFQLSDLFIFKNEIISNNSLLLSNVLYIKFSDKMQIQQIDDVRSIFNLEFEYQDILLQSIQVFKEKKEMVNIQIDKITHRIEEIKRLK